MGKTVDDIDIDNMDLSKYKFIIPAGTKWYRTVLKGEDPFLPTGKASRFASEPPGFTVGGYRSALANGQTVTAGTGADYFCEAIDTSVFEASGNLNDKDVYAVILKSDIELIDIDAICKAEGVSKPYMPEERTAVWHKFYGKKIKGLRVESAKDHSHYNIVIFPDWFLEFKKLVEKKQLDNASFMPTIKLLPRDTLKVL